MFWVVFVCFFQLLVVVFCFIFLDLDVQIQGLLKKKGILRSDFLRSFLNFVFSELRCTEISSNLRFSILNIKLVVFEEKKKQFQSSF